MIPWQSPFDDDSFFEWLKRKWRARFCNHRVLTVMRWHKAVRRPEMFGKELYVDVFDVYCFIVCTKCRKIFPGIQQDRLHAQDEADFKVQLGFRRS